MCVWIRPTLEPTAVAIVVVESTRGVSEGKDTVYRFVEIQVSALKRRVKEF